MNKIFKVIWSKAKGCYVVVSELAKANTKSTTGSKKVAKSMLAAMVLTSIGAGLPNVGHAAELGVSFVNDENNQGGVLSTSWVQGKFGDVNIWNAGGNTPLYSVLFGFNGNSEKMNAYRYGWTYDAQWIDTQGTQITFNAPKESVVMGHLAGSTANNTVVIGANAKVLSPADSSNNYNQGGSATSGGFGSVAVGYNSTVIADPYGVNAAFINANNNNGKYPGITQISGQSVAVGTNSVAGGQATAIGNDVYAVGYGSIAIGSDDNPAYYETKVTRYDAEHYFNDVYTKISPSYNKYGFDSAENAKYSPTLARGMGSISIGTRSFAYDVGSTAVGALAYALKPGSTAIGAQSRAEGDYSISIGNRALTFNESTIAVGNDTQVLGISATAYGNKAFSAGDNSLAIGSNVYANAAMYWTNDVNVNGSGNVDMYYADVGGSSLTNASLDRSIVGNNVQAVSRALIDGTSTSELADNLQNPNDGATKYIKNILNTNYTVPNDPAHKQEIYNDSVLKIYERMGLEGAYLSKDTEDVHGVTGVVRNSSRRANAIAIGSSTMAIATNSIGMGHLTSALGENSLALGNYAVTAMKNSTSLGTFARAYSNNSLALGTGAIVMAESNNALAIGASAITSGKNGMSIGTKATVEKRTDTFEKGENSMAIGNNAKAWLNNSLALGVSSETDYTKEDLALDPWVAKGSIATATSAKTGVISVGKKDAERRIVNVASGARDTDAVNVAQLRTAVERLDINIDELRNGGGFHYTSINSRVGSQAAQLAAKIGIQSNYDAYVTLKAKYLTYKAREKYNGETLNAGALNQLKAKIDELQASGMAVRVPGVANGIDYESKAAGLKN